MEVPVYRVNITKEQLRRLQEGDKETLVTLLEAQDKKIIEDLKKPTTTDNIAFLQGISYLTDSLLTKLKV
jgi:hypothetical protein